VGNADFGNMEILDSDDRKLTDVTGKMAERDIVQFVPFSQFNNNPFRLREEVLKEVPGQITEFYQKRGIKPQKGRGN
jgi:hypothetical protein